MENELKNGLCIDCRSKCENVNTKFILLTVIISVIKSTTLTLIIVAKINSEVSVNDFKIESFSLDTEKEEYQYSDSTHYSYTGSGFITCNNTNYDYEVLIEEYESNSKETKYLTSIVHAGKGEIKTYDYEFLEKNEKSKGKPNYTFKIIGYRSFKNN